MTINDLMARGGALNDLQLLNEKLKRPKTTNVLHKRSFGMMKAITPAAGGFTQIVQMELETDFNMVRIGIPNLHSATVAGVKVQVAVVDQWVSGGWYLAPTPSGGTWVDVTFNGAATGTLAARISAQNASITYTDLIPLKSIARIDAGGVRPLLAVKIQYPDGAVVTGPANDFYQWRAFTNTYGRQMRVSSQSVLGIDTPASYTTTTAIDTNACIPVIEYHTLNAGRQVMLLGDSTVEGTGATQRAWGAVQRVTTSLSTPDNPIEYYNLGMHGQGANTFMAAYDAFQPTVKATAIFAAPLSVNDIAVGGMNYLAYNAARAAIDKLVNSTADVFILGTLPFNPAFRDVGANDSKRIDFNQYLASLRMFTFVEDYVEEFSGVVDGDGQMQIKAGLTSDGVHPNEAGYEVLKLVVKPYVEMIK